MDLLEAEQQLATTLMRKGLGGLERMSRPELERVTRGLAARLRDQEQQLERLADENAAMALAEQARTDLAEATK